MVVITIHQPNYLPYLGLINKILSSDIFVVYDTAQFVRLRYDNRNYILSPKGEQILLTIPVDHTALFAPIKEAKIANPKILKKHWASIAMCYGLTPYFKEYERVLKNIYSTPYNSLAQLSLHIIKELLAIWGWKGKLLLSSELGIDTNLHSTDAIKDILDHVSSLENIPKNTITYLAGSSSKKYLEEDKLLAKSYTIKYFSFSPFVYPQTFSPFVPYMACLDYLFNMGPISPLLFT
jgi:hypothetical protein